MKPPKCDPLPEEIVKAAQKAETRVTEALDRIIALIPPAPYPEPTLLDEHRAMYALIRADERRMRR